ncbi:MAG: endonuclease III [Candidatus Abawacabacteria bacterium]|nr:endonuclease III [Candidatus Abawacabacteria bacterium]
MKTLQTKKVRAQKIVAILAKKYPEPKTALNFSNTFELLIATILSAQTTDKRVNIVTPSFFPKHNTPEQLFQIGEAKLADLIKSINLYPTKAKNIIRLCQILIEQYQGKVPATREALEALPGVGRKTANVVLANAFGIPAFAVDTHVFRVTRRLELSNGKNPLQVEKDITALLPDTIWTAAHHYFIFHGREICVALKPKCEICPVKDLCPYPKKQEKGQL